MNDDTWFADDRRDPSMRLVASTNIPLPNADTALSIAILAGPTSQRFKDGDWLEPVAAWITRDQAIKLRNFLNSKFPAAEDDGSGTQ